MINQISQAAELLSWLAHPPGITIFTLILALIISVVSALLSRVLTNKGELDRLQAAVESHGNEKKRLEQLKNEDPVRYQKDFIKWNRLEKSAQKMQQRIALARAKPSLITCVPMIILFIVLNSFFAGIDVALTPMNLWHLSSPLTNLVLNNAKGAHDGWINFGTWYFLASFAIGTVVTRIFGTAQPFNISNIIGGRQLGTTAIMTDDSKRIPKNQNQIEGGNRPHAITFPWPRSFRYFSSGIL